MSKPVHAKVLRTFMILFGAVLAILASTYFFSGSVGAADTASNSHVVNGGCSNYLPTGTVVAMAAPPDGSGYWVVNGAGQVVSCGGALSLPSLGPINLPIVGMASTPDGRGAWLVASDGGIFALGDARFYGSMGGTHLNQPIVGMASTPDGHGYWLDAADGGIFAFGDARFFGSTGSIHLNKPVVGMAVDTATGGYWLVASDGGIFAFHAPFLGSMGSVPLNKPVVGMSSTPDGRGYRLVAADGGIFSFGAPFYGSTGSLILNKPIVGMAVDNNGGGYWFVATDGGIFAFKAPFYGSAVAPPPTPSPPSPPPSSPPPQGILASFSCSGSAPEGVDITYSTDTSNYSGGSTVPWSATLAVPASALYVAVDAQLQGPDGSITCNLTVTWPGGSATQSGNAVGNYNIASAEICSDEPFDSGWTACG